MLLQPGGLPKNSTEFSLEPSFIRTTNFTKKPIVPLHFAKSHCQIRGKWAWRRGPAITEGEGAGTAIGPEGDYPASSMPHLVFHRGDFVVFNMEN
jgi:hypothetical protein